ncbi:MAG: hypothetical protein LBK53_09170 [Heliobacteriaceae bacterium]|jgi:hypothetical protein|nr:hypothetical protein [Heliobacteriaceae bacterium]
MLITAGITNFSNKINPAGQRTVNNNYPGRNPKNDSFEIIFGHAPDEEKLISSQSLLLKKLAEIKRKHHFFPFLKERMFSSENIAEIVLSVKEPQEAELKLKLAKTLAESKKPDGSYRFRDTSATWILEVIHIPEQVLLAEELIKLTNSDGKPRFNFSEIEVLLLVSKTPEKASLTGELIGLTNDDGSPEFDWLAIKRMVSQPG